MWISEVKGKNPQQYILQIQMIYFSSLNMLQIFLIKAFGGEEGGPKLGP